jgi:hypothetical protein
MVAQPSHHAAYNPAVAKNPNPAPRQFKVGDRVKVSMHGGKVVDAVIKAVIDRTDGLHYQVDFGNEQTALVGEWQAVKD